MGLLKLIPFSLIIDLISSDDLNTLEPFSSSLIKVLYGNDLLCGMWPEESSGLGSGCSPVNLNNKVYF